MIRRLFAGLGIFLILSAGCTEQKSTSADRLETVMQTEGVIWSFAFLSPQEMLVTLRRGVLLYIDTERGIQKPLPLPPVQAQGQGGLLDVHTHSIDDVLYVYLTYSTDTGGQLSTALARGVWNGETIENMTQLFAARAIGNSSHHFGSRLFMDDDYIYMTIGDHGERDYSQDLSYHNGKILRLQFDGSAAADNPFADNADALPEIWSYGHRNPQGIDYDSASGKLYSAEFGPRGGDELNLIEAGKNYGWPVITYGKEYWGPSIGETHHPDMEQPVTYWVPSISPSGMAFYSGDKIAQWKNNLFLAALGEKHLRRLVIEDGEVAEQEVLFEDIGERIRHVRSGLDGYLYFSTDSGKIIKVIE